jgi:hypothetical protein
MVDLITGTTMLTRKAKPGGNGHDHDAEDLQERKTPIDVDERLAAMRWHGPGNTAINVTQRDVMASLLRHHVALNEATATVLEATRHCVSGYPEAAKWDWHEEESNISWNGARLINKDPTLVDRLPDDLRLKFQELDDAGRRPSIRRNRFGLFVSPARGPSTDTEGEPGTKKGIVRGLLLKGTTVAEVLAATGWPSISMPHTAHSCGLKLLKSKEGDGPTKYRGVPEAEEIVPNRGQRPRQSLTAIRRRASGDLSWCHSMIYARGRSHSIS